MTAAARSRPVFRPRLAAVSLAGSLRRSIDANRQLGVQRATEAAAQGADLVCLPEAFTAMGVPVGSVAELAETVPGPTTDALASVATTHGCYILCPIYTRRAQYFFNSAVLIDRRGAIAGIYDKAHPSATAADFGEFELGVTPGPPACCFDLDFGRTGIQICMDAGFPESWQALARGGARLVLWPSSFDGGKIVEAFATLHNFYVLCGVRSGRARLINPCGRIVEQTRVGHDAIASAEVSLEYLVVHQMQRPDLVAEIDRRYGARASAELYRDEALILIESHDPELGVADICEQLGVDTATDYMARHGDAYRARAGGAGEASATTGRRRP